MEKFKKFLKGGGSELLRKALDSGASSGGALIHEYLEQVITDQIISQYPEYAFIRPKKISSDSYKHKARNARGSVGGAMGEGATTGVTNNTFTQPEIPLKVVRRKPRVTDFLRNATEDNIDAFAQEVEYEVMTQALSLNMYNLFGNAAADSYQYSGWDKSITTNRNLTNIDGFTSGAPTVPSNLVPFDNMIDLSNRKGGRGHRRAFIMSSEMSSLLGRLYTNIRKNIPMETVRVAGGHELETYRGIPILESTVIPGAGSTTMGTVTAASGGTTGGTLSNGNYFFRVSAITPDGEQQASAEATVALAGGTATQQIALSWAAVTDAIGYKVFYSATTGLSGMSLIRWIPAKTYDGNGTITGNVTGVALLDVTADSSVTGISSDKPLTAVSGVNGESIYLIDFDDFQGMGRFAHNNHGNREDGIISVEQLAKTDGFLEMLIYTHGAIIPAFETTSVKASGWRVA